MYAIRATLRSSWNTDKFDVRTGRIFAIDPVDSVNQFAANIAELESDLPSTVIGTTIDKTNNYPSFLFNNTNDAIRYGTIKLFNSLEGLTAFAVYKRNSLTNLFTAGSTIMGQFLSATNATFILYWSGTTNPIMRFNVYVGSTGYSANIDMDVDTEWHTMCGVFNGNYSKLYHDGVQVAEIKTAIGKIGTTTTANFSIGSYQLSNDSFVGNLGHCAVYDIPLNDRQVNELHNFHIKNYM